MVVYMNLEDKKKKRMWVKKWMEDRNKYGHMPLLNELRENFPSDFKNYHFADVDQLIISYVF